MIREGCALASDETTGGNEQDLFLAIAICSRPYNEFDEWMLSGAYYADCKTWGKAIIKHMNRNPKSFNLLEKFNLFKVYMKAGSEIPPVWNEKKTNNKPSGTHWTEIVSMTLQKELHKTEIEVLSMPMNKALRYYFVHMEALGQVTLKTDKEISTPPVMSTLVIDAK